MNKDETKNILENVARGTMTVDEALLELKKAPFKDIGCAKIDLHRALRKGAAEVIYGASKSADEITDIVRTMLNEGEKTVLITRIDENKAAALQAALPITYFKRGHAAIAGEIPTPNGRGKILIITAGTSDIPVAEEALAAARALGNECVTVYDAGVAGLHRLLSHIDEIMSANVIIAIAGMEGALASVVGGIADAPVIAVPTSVGYGTSFGGVSALLSMLNSCASGVTVVNIDNGFGAAYFASMINHK